MTPLIHVLPQQVADRIAAGEVIERPASIVKELIENALDAGARRLELELEAGGVRLVRLTDDGHGMTAEDLVLSVLPHATSKISSVEDLFRVASFGFRGEALPSIASVSQTVITSRRPGDALGARLVVSSGSTSDPLPAGAPPGTLVEVKNLFWNVPVRRKFLKQERTELSQCVEAVTRLLLPHPEVSIRVTHNGRRVLETHEDADYRARIRAFFGGDVGEKLIAIDAGGSDLHVHALIGPPSMTRASASLQYIFLNGRWIRDRSLSFALKDAYRGLTMPKDYPIGFLFIGIDPADVDVNVHPTKAEVRFRERDRVVGWLRSILRERLMNGVEERALDIRGSGERTPAVTARTEPNAGLRGDLLTQLEVELFPGGIEAPAPLESVVREAAPLGQLLPRSPMPSPSRAKIGSRCREIVAAPLALDAGTSRFLQLHRSFIVVETRDGFEIIDQHALHERKLYDELVRRFEAAEGEDQRLLIPEVVELGPADFALVLGVAEELAQAGVEIEAFGGSSVCVRSLPLVISRLSGEDLLLQVVESLKEEKPIPGRREILHDVLAGLACRAAVKFQDALDPSEISALLSWRRRNPEARNCPHGRPVAMAVTLAELFNQFMRKR